VGYRADLPEPTLVDSTSVRVRIHSAALNHLDLFVVEGLPGVTIRPPWVLGADGAGVVDAVGAEVRDIAVGDRVVINPGLSDRTCEYCRAGEHSLCPRFRLMGEHVSGTIAELVVLPSANVRRLRADVSFDEAAACGLVGLTAWRMLVSRARVMPDEDVLIWGIGGGVALAALRIAKSLGARVWVTSGSDAKLERAAALGADVCLNHRTADVPAEIRSRTTKRGMNVVVDSVGQATWARSLGALGRGGRLVTCGATSGPALEIDARRLFWNQWTVMGSTMGNDHEFDAIVQELGLGRLRVPIDSTFPIAEGRAALQRLASDDHFGKVVIRVIEDP